MKIRPLFLLMALLAVVPGCASCSNDWKHIKSSVLGLKRTITLYAADGSVIREWHAKAKVEDNGGTAYFIDDGGHAITVSGTFVIEEE